MKPPPFIIGTALLFWGFQTDHPVVAAVLAAAMEGLPRLGFRWQLGRHDFIRIADFSTILFLGLAAYLILSKRSVHALFDLFQWLPLVQSPLYLAQVLSADAAVPLSALFFVARKTENSEPHSQRPGIDLTYPFTAVCVLSAAAANARGHWFLAGTVSIAAYGLWPWRSRRFSPLLWGALLLLATMGGYAGQTGLHKLQGIIENKGYQIFAHLFTEAPDPFRSVTAIGEIKSLKRSGRIVLRVNPQRMKHRPHLLRATTYNRYRRGIWSAGRSPFIPASQDEKPGRWHLHPFSGATETVKVVSTHHREGATIHLPGGTVTLDMPSEAQVTHNNLGAVTVRNYTGLFSYTASFTPETAVDAPPSATDLEVDPSAESAVRLTLRSLCAPYASAPPPAALLLSAIQRLFAEDFTYSLTLTAGGPSPLSDFLLHVRTGHCEYFATAAVMLLRAAGIPARYASGYSVQEFSRLEKRFIVRARHAHAWVRVFSDGRWIDFDPTPAAWFDLEAASRPFWRPATDLFDWVSLTYRRWQQADQPDRPSNVWLWLAIPAAMMIIRRLRRARSVAKIRLNRPADAESPIPASPDSPVYGIEERLSRAGYPRQSHETLKSWAMRLEASPHRRMRGLSAVVDLHYRYRFDPCGISAAEADQLDTLARQWLRRCKKDWE